MTQQDTNNRQIFELDNELIQALIKGFQDSMLEETNDPLLNIKLIDDHKTSKLKLRTTELNDKALSFDPKFWALFMAMIEVSLITMLPLQDSLRALRLEVSPEHTVIPTPETVQWFETMVENLSKPQQEEKEETLAEPLAA